MSQSENIVSLDKRDLFDSVRSAIKEAMIEQGSREDGADLWSEATDKANECLSGLYYSSDALIKPEPDDGPMFGDFPLNKDCSAMVGGMTLRDYFAAKAMQSMFSRALELGKGDAKGAVAISAYEMADAMRAERAK